MTQAAFETLTPPKRETVFNAGPASYKVYKDVKEFVTVSAASALEAMKTSGIEAIYKIERDSLAAHRVLDPAKAVEIVMKKDEPAAAAATPAADAAAPAAPAAEAAAPAAEAPKA